MHREFTWQIRVYYEDTDAGEVVFYANYLKFLERARSEAIYSLGYTNSELLTRHGILLIVKSCNIEYKKPAKFEDILYVISEFTSFTRTSFLMKQTILKNNELISDADIHLVSVDKNGKPSKIPDELKQKLEN